MQKSIRSIFVVVALLALFPYFLRRRWRVVRRTLVKAAPDAIFPHLENPSNWPAWTEWSRRESMDFTYEGPAAGVGATQRWVSGKVDGVLRIVQCHPPERLAYELEMGRGRYHIDGTFSLERIGTFTRVTWICSWVGDANPYARYLDLIFKFWIGRDFETGLANLRELVEKGTPAPAQNIPA